MDAGILTEDNTSIYFLLLLVVIVILNIFWENNLVVRITHIALLILLYYFFGNPINKALRENGIDPGRRSNGMLVTLGLFCNIWLQAMIIKFRNREKKVLGWIKCIFLMVICQMVTWFITVFVSVI